MYLFLVRHAQTKASRNQWQTPDSKLGRIGEKQTILLSKRSRFSMVDAVFSSKWERSKRTAEIVSDKLKVKTKTLDYIHEREQTNRIYGSLRDSKISNEYIRGYQKNFGNLDWKFTKGEESVREVLERTNKLSELLVKQHADKSVLVVSHDVFIRCFLSMVLLGKNYSDNTMSRVINMLSIYYTGISLLRYSHKRRVWRVYYINDFSHLKDMRKEEV